MIPSNKMHQDRSETQDFAFASIRFSSAQLFSTADQYLMNQEFQFDSSLDVFVRQGCWD
jgi:hypothetical protein